MNHLFTFIANQLLQNIVMNLIMITLKRQTENSYNGCVVLVLKFLKNKRNPEMFLNVCDNISWNFGSFLLKHYLWSIVNIFFYFFAEFYELIIFCRIPQNKYFRINIWWLFCTWKKKIPQKIVVQHILCFTKTFYQLFMNNSRISSINCEKQNHKFSQSDVEKNRKFC